MSNLKRTELRHNRLEHLGCGIFSGVLKVKHILRYKSQTEVPPYRYVLSVTKSP
jgi:hypothetical protein